MAKQARKNAGNHPTEPQPGPGHNNPPSQAELMAEKHEGLTSKIAALANKASDLPSVIRTEEHLSVVTGVIIEAQTLAKQERAAFTAEKAPWLSGSREVDSFFNVHKDRLAKLLERLNRRCDLFHEERIERERAAAAKREAEAKAEAERQAELAAKHAGTKNEEKHEARATVASTRAAEAGAAATAPAADHTRVKLDNGVLSTAQEIWEGAVVDLTKLQQSLGPLGPYIKVEHLEAAAERWAKATKGLSIIPGLKAEKRVKSITRR